MAVRIEVEKSGSNVTLRAPEHPLLAARAEALGGRAKGGAWTFAASQEDAVRALAKELWGTDGRDGGTATLRVDLSLYGEGPLGRQGEAWLCGRMVARRRRFDSPVELGPDVKLVAGSFSTWGGSPGRPALGTRYQTVVDVAGVPKAVASAAEREFPYEVKIVESGSDAVVGAWSRTVTERIPGPRSRAEATMSGGEPAPARAKTAPSPKPVPRPAPGPAPSPGKAPAPTPGKAPAPAPAKTAVTAVGKAAQKVARQAAKKTAAAAQTVTKAAKKAGRNAGKVAAKATAAVKAAAKKASRAAKKVARQVVRPAAPKAAAKKAPKAAAKKAPKRPAKKAPKATAKKAPKRPAKKTAARKAPKARAKMAPARKAARRTRR